MIGDSYSSDIAGAKAAGIDQIWLHKGETTETTDTATPTATTAATTATYIIPELKDVLTIL